MCISYVAVTSMESIPLSKGYVPRLNSLHQSHGRMPERMKVNPPQVCGCNDARRMQARTQISEV